MERLKSMKEALISCAQSNMGNLANVNAEELGEVIDMVKDLEEAIYYHTITDSMKKQEEEPSRTVYYTTERYYPDYGYNRMYGGGSGGSGSGGSSGGSSGGGSRGYRDGNRQSAGESRNYEEYEYPMMMRDYREGRSGNSRKMYMESKEQHKDTSTKIRELEKYMNELSMDITEMIEGASPEEKQMLQKKINTLASKINV